MCYQLFLGGVCCHTFSLLSVGYYVLCVVCWCWCVRLCLVCFVVSLVLKCCPFVAVRRVCCLLCVCLSLFGFERCLLCFVAASCCSSLTVGVVVCCLLFGVLDGVVCVQCRCVAVVRGRCL